MPTKDMLQKEETQERLKVMGFSPIPIYDGAGSFTKGMIKVVSKRALLYMDNGKGKLIRSDPPFYQPGEKAEIIETQGPPKDKVYPTLIKEQTPQSPKKEVGQKRQSLGTLLDDVTKRVLSEVLSLTEERVRETMEKCHGVAPPVSRERLIKSDYTPHKRRVPGLSLQAILVKTYQRNGESFTAYFGQQKEGNYEFLFCRNRTKECQDIAAQQSKGVVQTIIHPDTTPEKNPSDNPA